MAIIALDNYERLEKTPKKPTVLNKYLADF